MNTKDFLYKIMKEKVDKSVKFFSNEEKLDFSLEEDKDNYIVLSDKGGPIIEFSKNYCRLINNNFYEYQKLYETKPEQTYSLLNICKEISDKIDEYNNPKLLLLKQNDFNLGSPYYYNENMCEEFYLMDERNDEAVGYYNVEDDNLTVFSFSTDGTERSFLKSQMRLSELIWDNLEIFGLSENIEF